MILSDAPVIFAERGFSLWLQQQAEPGSHPSCWLPRGSAGTGQSPSGSARTHLPESPDPRDGTWAEFGSPIAAVKVPGARALLEFCPSALPCPGFGVLQAQGRSTVLPWVAALPAVPRLCPRAPGAVEGRRGAGRALQTLIAPANGRAGAHTNGSPLDFALRHVCGLY